MNTYTYVAIWKGKEITVSGVGLTLYHAKLRAIEQLKVPRAQHHMVSIMLAAKDDDGVIHHPGELG